MTALAYPPGGWSSGPQVPNTTLPHRGVHTAEVSFNSERNTPEVKASPLLLLCGAHGGLPVECHTL